MSSSGNLFQFHDNSDEAKPVENKASEFWTILVVDDEEDVHKITELTLAELVILDRPLKFLHAYSAKEAFEILKNNNDIAVALLDVVMESDDSGLKLVKDIRETLQMDEIQIILRTGHPGYAPEKEVIQKYDINDYKMKTELTQIRMLTSLISAVRTFSQIRYINRSRKGLEFLSSLSPQIFSCTSPFDFIRLINKGIKGLITTPLELCISGSITSNEENPCEQILYGSGRFYDWIGLNVENIPEKDIHGYLKESRELQQSQVFEKRAVLFIGDGSEKFLSIYMELERPFCNVSRQLIDVLIMNFRAGFNNVLLMERLRTYAYQDLLTDLPNRKSFLDQISRSLSRTDYFSVGIIDLDSFTSINNALGYDTGDILIRNIALRIRETMEDRIYVSRISGDTFGLLSVGTALSPQEILAIFEKPFFLDATPFPIKASLGLVNREGHHKEAIDVFKDAFMAMKQAKNLYDNKYFFYSPDMEKKTQERIRIIRELRQAIDTGAFHLCYHPQIDLDSGEVIGAESLLRWKTPEGMLISPLSFIPVAESSGQIVEIGNFVIDEAFKQARKWFDSGEKGLTVAVNVSVRQFYYDEFLDFLKKTLKKYDLDPKQIELEVTESMVMKDVEHVIEILTAVRQLGMSISVDDFGTGFSSLSYLQRLPVNRLKIDRSFIENIMHDDRARTISNMIIKMGKELGLKVIAEGLQNRAQIRYLKQLGCDEGQGYFFAEPMLASEMNNWLKEYRENQVDF